MNTAVIDLSLLMQYASNDKSVVQELISLFFSETESALLSLKNGIDHDDATIWTEAAHKIKGSAGYIGAEQLKALSAEAQMMEIAGKHSREDMFHKIKNAYEEVEHELKHTPQLIT